MCIQLMNTIREPSVAQRMSCGETESHQPFRSDALTSSRCRLYLQVFSDVIFFFGNLGYHSRENRGAEFQEGRDDYHASSHSICVGLVNVSLLCVATLSLRVVLRLLVQSLCV